jgi:hypothetical protein
VRARSSPGLVLLAALFVLADCSFFSRQPPLPRRAAVEPDGDEQAFTNLVESADIIYFPVESISLARGSAASKILEALKRNGRSFSLGWDLAVGDENMRHALLNEASRSGAEFFEVHEVDPAALEGTPEFVPPPEDFERFARRSSSRGLKEGALRAEYKAALFRQQFAAEKIVSHFKEHRTEKIIVFLRRDEVRGDYGVPYFVAQKTKARQLILNPQRRRDSGPGLFARN